MIYGISSLVYPAETLCYFIIERKLKFDIGVGRVAAFRASSAIAFIHALSSKHYFYL